MALRSASLALSAAEDLDAVCATFELAWADAAAPNATAAANTAAASFKPVRIEPLLRPVASPNYSGAGPYGRVSGRRGRLAAPGASDQGDAGGCKAEGEQDPRCGDTPGHWRPKGARNPDHHRRHPQKGR